MAISFEQMQSLLQQRQLQFEKSQRQLIQLLSEKLNIQVEWEPEPRLTSQEIVSEYHKLLSLNHDPEMIATSDHSVEPQPCHTVICGQNVNGNVPNRKLPTALWNGDGRHSVRNCAHTNHHCQKAHQFRCAYTPRLQASYKFKRNRYRGTVRETAFAVFRTHFSGKRKYPTVKRKNVPISLLPETLYAPKSLSRGTRAILGTSSVKPTILTVQKISEEPLQLKGRIACERRLNDLLHYGKIYPVYCAKVKLHGTNRITRLDLLKESMTHVSSVTTVTLCNIGRTYFKFLCLYQLPVRATLMSWPKPEPPWSQIHVDLGGFPSRKSCDFQVTQFLREGGVTERD
ncbi:unnamed protein product [Dicrocoelium dendriticum]|nr:unnamed protein product [Dicrocoelium dendriticum]